MTNHTIHRWITDGVVNASAEIYNITLSDIFVEEADGRWRREEHNPWVNMINDHHTEPLDFNGTTRYTYELILLNQYNRKTALVKDVAGVYAVLFSNATSGSMTLLNEAQMSD